MGSFQNRKQFYNPEELDQLEWLFDSVWAAIQAQERTGAIPDEELKTILRQTLFGLAFNGNSRDEDELRATVLSSVMSRARIREARRNGVGKSVDKSEERLSS